MGHHVLLSLYGVDFKLLNDLLGIIDAFELAVKATGATVLNRFSHQFEPQGVTVVYALSESHISIHSFPEDGTCAIDVYTCGEGNPRLIALEMLKYLNSTNYSIREIYR